MQKSLDNKQSRREWLKTVSVGLATIAVPGSADAAITPPPPPAPGVHRVLTCNILLDLAEHKGEMRWKEKRRQACMEIIKAYSPDLICLQEVGRGQYQDFRDAFPDFASFGFVDPASDTNPRRFHSIRNVILYRNDHYAMTSEGSYWISDTPMIAGSGLPGQNLARHVTWVRLRDLRSQKEFRLLDTHWPLEQHERIATAKIIVPEAAQYSDSFPQIFCGDFNSQLGTPELQMMLDAGWVDSYTAATRPEDRSKNRKIDFIFTRGTARATGAGTILDTLNGVRPSDHPFVWADVKI